MEDFPIYLFTGFLESGKTRFIQETLCDSRFNSGERTLLLICEEGEEEYDSSAFSGENVFLHVIDSQEELTSENLSAIAKKCKAERAVIEYNGMWTIDKLYSALPEGWTVYQEMMFADAGSFLSYNANMRSLVVDKLQSCELLILNRATESTDKEEIHKVVRGVTRRSDIAYEYVDGHVEYDDIEDPLPFDIEADVIEIEDRDYALWYRDLAEDMEKYIGKTVRFKGMVVAGNPKQKNTFVFGRKIMVCCADDVAMRPVLCKDTTKSYTPKQNDWLIITATISLEKNEIYKGKGPVLYISELEPAQAPEQEVATFY